jgi:hypothetical protein
MDGFVDHFGTFLAKIVVAIFSTWTTLATHMEQYRMCNGFNYIKKL